MRQNIIADTSCLILLDKIGELTILQKLFGTIIITPEVSVEFGHFLPGWIEEVKVGRSKQPELLNTTLGPGEISAIELAIERRGLLILDDMKARKLASNLELDVTGTFGVLLDAKHIGYIESFRDVLDRIKKTNFHITEDLERKLLELAGE